MEKIIWRKLNKIRSYKKVFLNAKGIFKPEAEIVLKDMMDFCHILSDYKTSNIELAFIEGRRQLFKHLWKRLNIEESELLKLAERE